MDAVVPKKEDEVVVGKEEEEVVGKSTISRKCRSSSRDVLRATTGSCPAPSAIDKWLTAPACRVQPAPPCSSAGSIQPPNARSKPPQPSQQWCKGCRRRHSAPIYWHTHLRTHSGKKKAKLMQTV